MMSVPFRDQPGKIKPPVAFIRGSFPCPGLLAAPTFRRLRAEIEFEGASLCEHLVGHLERPPRRSVQAGGLDIYVFRTIVFRDNGETPAGMVIRIQADGHFVEYRGG